MSDADVLRAEMRQGRLRETLWAFASHVNAGKELQKAGWAVIQSTFDEKVPLTQRFAKKELRHLNRHPCL